MGINRRWLPTPNFDSFLPNINFNKDLDDNNQLTDLIKQQVSYPELAQNDEIKKLTKMKYRNRLRHTIYELADEFVGE